ncbi:MAG TPA: 2-oxo-4-hydroxy-4-carboxy-5-ureidoimidazoline decarboxylase [Polyangiaceae bacterium]
MTDEESRSLEPHEFLNGAARQDAERALFRCCGAERWVARMLERRPFASRADLFSSAESIWWALDGEDFREAFSHHPEIGDLSRLRERFAATAELSEREQAAVAGSDEATLIALREGNRLYKERFGFLFIVRASGRTAAEMLELLRARSKNEPDVELRIAAAEQYAITRLRLENLAR